MKAISRANGEHYEWGDGCDGWHLVKSAALSVILERVPPGGSEVRHFHRSSEQFFFVLSGVATMEADGEVFRLEAHQGIHIPKGVPHQLRNEEECDLNFTVTSTPPSHGDRERA